MAPNIIYRADIDLTQEPRAAAAFERMRPKYAAIPVEALIAVNADVTYVVTTIASAAPRLEGLREGLRKAGIADTGCIDELSDCADGLGYAEGEYRTGQEAENLLADLGRECSETRAVFFTDLGNLALHGVIEGAWRKEYSGAAGYSNTIADVRLLGQVYRNEWEAIAGRTCRTLEELDRAEGVVHRMDRLVGDRRVGPAGVSEAAELRTRAFTYAVKRYDEAKRLTVFARWHEDDAETYAPSLYGNRGGGRRKPDQPAPQPNGPQQPAQPQPVIGPNGPFMPAPATPSTGGNGSSNQNRLAGLPGGSPFMP